MCKGKRNGAVISIIAQIFQIPYIITAGCIYTVTSGLQLITGIVLSNNFTKFQLMWILKPYFEMYFGNIVKYNMIGISIVPIIIILYIRRTQKVEKSNQLENNNEMVSETNSIS